MQNDGITILYDSNIIKPIPICYYCSVKFNPNGGTFTDGTTDTKVVSNIYRTENIPEKVQNENKITNPTKSGYTFVGWTLEKDDASTQVDPANISKNITGSRFDGITDDGMTFYALYTVAPKPATVTISGPTDNTVKAGEGSDVFTVAANKGDTDAAKVEFDFAGGKVQYRTGDTGEWLDLTSNELNIDDLTGKQFRVVPDADAVTAQKTLTVKLMDASDNEIAGASDSKTFTVTARVHATVEINELNGKTIKQNKPYTFTVTVTAHDDSGNAILTFDNVAGLTYNGTAVTDAGVTVTLTNQPAPLTFTLTPDAEGAGKTLTATLNNGAMDTATYTVSEYEHAKVTITGLDGTTVKAGEAKEFTVSVTPNDDANTGAKATITVSGANADAVEKIQYKDGETWKDVPGEGLSIDEINNTEFKLITKADANDGDVTITVTANKANGTEIDKKVAAVTVKKHENAAVTITDLDGTTVKAGEAKEFTVNVTPNDDTIDKVTFGTTSGEVQWSSDNGNTWTTVPGDVDYSDLTGKQFRVVPAADAANGTVTVTVTAKKADGTEAAKKDASFTVTKKEEPVTPGGGSTGGGENPGENPGSGSTTPKRKLEIADGTLTSVTVKDENGNLKDITDTITKDLDGKYEIPVGAKVTITARMPPRA